MVTIINEGASMDKFLTTEQVAQRLNIHQNTVLRHIKDGILPATKVGKMYRIKESALAALVGETPHPIDQAMVIAVSNQKGGVSKTTTAVNLATALSRHGKRVLLVDLDPQGGCAVCLGMDTSSLNRTVYNVLVDQQGEMSKVIKPTAYGFDLAPSNIDLAGAEVELKQMLAQESILRRRLEPTLNNYDFIIIDTPPSLGILTVNALTAAHQVLIPVACEFMALRGLAMLLDTIRSVQAVTNPNLKILGMLATKYDVRTVNSKEVYEYLEAFSRKHGIKLFNEYIKHSVRFVEAPSEGRPLIVIHPELEGAKAYNQVAEEIIYGK
jgi:chromosome partitioning protein